MSGTANYSSPRWAALAAGGLVAYLIWDQQHWWGLKAEYAFGYLVPFFAAFVIYERWAEIGPAFRPSSGPVAGFRERQKSLIEGILEALSLVAVGGGLLSFGLGALYKTMEGNNLISSNFMATGFAAVLLGGAFYYADWPVSTEGAVRKRLRVAALFVFPALIWMLSVPMFSALERGISTFLMNKVALVVYTVFDVLGYAVIREGSILRLPLGDVGVEDACSGIRSLMASLFAGSFLAAVTFTALWKKVFLVATAMLFAFINNIFRSLFLTAWAYAKGPEGLDGAVVFFGVDLGNVHDLTGWVVLGLTVGCLLLLVKLFSIRLTYQINPEELR
jgi:exosortase